MVARRVSGRRGEGPLVVAEIWFAVISVGLGVIAGLAFMQANVEAALSAIGGVGTAILVALVQIRFSVHKNWEAIHATAEERAQQVCLHLTGEAARLTREVAAALVVQSAVLKGEDTILQCAMDFQQTARQSIRAMWTVMSYSKLLGDYLEQSVSDALTREAGVRQVERVIDLANPMVHILDHLKRTWPFVQDGRYVVRFAKEIGLEMLLVDAHGAALFLQPRIEFDCVHVFGSGPAFVNAVSESFNQVWERGRIMSEAIVSAPFDPVKVKEWLVSQT
jgi:hypothetical protein